MKDLVIKADRAVLNVVSHYVKRWIAHQEEKGETKHKIDFLILAEKWRVAAMVLWAVILPTVLWALQGETSSAAIHVLLWGAFAAFEWYAIGMTTNRMKMLHDWLYGMRETPAVYEMEKRSCEQLFVDSRRRRLKQTALMLAIVGGLALLFYGLTESSDPNNIVWQYLVANTVANTVLRYVVHVFDFEPPKKKKKASEAISEMLAKLWRELTEGFAPAPAFQRV